MSHEPVTQIIHVYDGVCDGVLQQREQSFAPMLLQAAEIIIGVSALTGRMADLGLNLLTLDDEWGKWITWWRRDAYQDPAGIRDIADWKQILPPREITGVRMQCYGTQVGPITAPLLYYGMDLLLHGTLL